MPPFRDLPTGDKVLMFVTGLVGFLAVTMAVVVIIGIFTQKGAEVAPIVDLLSSAFLMLTGAVVGYIGGRNQDTKKDD